MNLLTRLRVPHRFQNHLEAKHELETSFKIFYYIWGVFVRGGGGGKSLKLLEFVIFNFYKGELIPMTWTRMNSVRIRIR